jgi:hypothetical protein
VSPGIRECEHGDASRGQPGRRRWGFERRHCLARFLLPCIPAVGKEGCDECDCHQRHSPVEPRRHAREVRRQSSGDAARFGGQQFVRLDWLGDVLHAPRAGCDETRRNPVLHLIANRSRDQHAARPGERLQACGDVDGISERAAGFRDDVAEIDADAQLHPTLGRKRSIFFRDLLLDCQRAPDGVHCARKLGHQAVTDAAEGVAAAVGDEAVEDGAAQLEPGERRLFVGAHQPAVFDHVGREDGDDSPIGHLDNCPVFKRFRRILRRHAMWLDGVPGPSAV